MDYHKRMLLRKAFIQYIIVPILVVAVLALIVFWGLPKLGVKGTFHTVAIGVWILFLISLYKPIQIFLHLGNSLYKNSNSTNSTHKKIFELNLILGWTSFVNVTYQDKEIKDKNYILLALLVYARVLRLLPNSYSEIQVDCCNIFLEFNEGLNKNPEKRGQFFSDLRGLFDPLAKSTIDVPPLNVICYENTIYVGTISTKNIDKYIYLIFIFALDNISPLNKGKLFDSFVSLSKHRITHGLSQLEAVMLPNQIANNLSL